MNLRYEVVSHLTVNIPDAALSEESEGTDVHVSYVETEFALIPPEEVDPEVYITNFENLTQEGSRMVTEILVQALIGNIHYANIKGYRADFDHLKHIVSELETGFMETNTYIQEKQIEK